MIGRKSTRKANGGSCGIVYLEKSTLGSYAKEVAIKHISIPIDAAEVNAIIEEHGPVESAVLCCLDEVRYQVVGEYQRMYLLNGHTNIVTCHDIGVLFQTHSGISRLCTKFHIHHFVVILSYNSVIQPNLLSAGPVELSVSESSNNHLETPIIVSA